MKRLLAILCTLALMLSVINPTVFAAENSSLQAAMDDDSSEIIVLEEDASNLTVDRDTTIDLNGHSIDGVTVTGGTLYCLDSQTADYTVADGIYGHVTNVTGNVKAAEGYLQVGDSFHAVNLDIYAMTLRASDVGVYYKSNFAADEVVAEQVESFGVALSVVTAPNADNLDTYCGYSVFTGFEAGEGANATGTSTLLKGIMKAANSDKKNEKNAAMPIYGRAYIKTSEGYIFGETVKRSLQEQVEAIDGVWASLTDSQKAPVLGMLASYTAVMEGWNIPNIRGIQVPGADEEIQIPVNVTAENGIVTEAVTVEQDGVSVTVPAGVKLAEGAEALTLTVTPKETSDTGIQLEKNEVLMPMDVHVEGLAADNAQPLTIYLGKIMPENLNMGNYTVYHVENGNANEMTLIPVDAEFTAHNQYKYSLDGELTLYVANFSEFAARATTNNAWNGGHDYKWYNTADTTLYIRNADQLAGFGAIVGGMDGQTADDFANKIVVLTSDISIGDAVADNGKVFYPIGYYNDYGGYTRVSGVAVNSWFKPFRGTFDGNGNTISDFYQNTWEMFGDYNDGYSGTPNYYREGMGLFGKVYGGTVRNLNVRNFSCDSEHGTSGTIASYADCGATFENIAIFDCNPRVYNIGNGGIVGCAGWYAAETADEKVTFRNITVDNSNKISALWDASGTSAGGILGQYYPTSGQSSASYPTNPGVLFKDCRVSAILEVNNDCISNYHYYWYRYTGMLMGSVRANKIVDGYTMADTTGITAEDCEVSYGHWNEFWYCELVKNSIASYTHDYQFGRLTSITDLSEITSDGGKTWLKEGNFALLDENRNCVDCYHIFKHSEGYLYRHFHDVDDETNPNIYESFDLNGDGELNDLKEDRQRYLLPFNQILTGDGMGILAHREFDGVTVVEKDEEGIRSSQEKFTAPESYTTVNGELKLSELFAAKEGVAISAGSVQAYISPVGEDSTVKPAACVISDGDWKNGTLKIEGLGKAKITITDYWYCTPTTLSVNVEKAVIRYNAPNGVTSVDCDENGATLPVAVEVENKNFIGWAEKEITETTTEPTVMKAGETYKPVKVMTDLYAVYSYTVEPTDAKTYELVDLADIAATDKVVITMTTNEGSITTYTLSSANGTGSAPKADSVTVKGSALVITDTENLLWNIDNNNGNLTIYPDGTTDTWLYCTSTNNGVRVGTNENKVFTIDATSGYLKNTGTSRYVGVYTTNPDWRCYTNTTGNIANQVLRFYKEIAASGEGGGTYYVTISAACKHNDTTTTVIDATCQTEGSSVVFCNDCREQVGETEIIPVLNHNYENGVCTMCGDTKAGEYVLVTDDTDLEIGDQVVIVATNSKFAMSTTQNGNNRGQVSVTKGDNTVEINNNVQELILQAGNKDNTYALYTGDGYLYAASSSNNYLRTEKELSDNSSWTITIADDVATVKANGTNTRNWLRYNSSSSLFACYASGQQDISIYKWTEYCKHTQATEKIETVAPTCTEAGYSYKICDNCGEQYDVTEGGAATGHTEVIDAAVDATCQTTGLTEGKHCSVCNEVMVKQTVIPITDEHTDADDDSVCDLCGVPISSGDETIEQTTTMSITGTTGTLASGNGSISWTSGDVTFTNVKGSTAIRTVDDDHYRMYIGSSVMVSANNNKIKSITITCTSSDHAKQLQEDIIESGYDKNCVSASGSDVTITLGLNVVELVINKITVQTRVKAIAVTYEKAVN